MNEFLWKKRLLHLLTLTEQPNGISKAAVLEELGVSKRTAENMKNTLIQRGYCIENSGKGKGIWWRNTEREAADCNEQGIMSTELDAKAAIYMFLLQTSNEDYTKDGFYRYLQEREEGDYRRILYASQSKAFQRTVDRLFDNDLISLKKTSCGDEIIKITHNATQCFPVMTDTGTNIVDDIANDIFQLIKDYDSRRNRLKAQERALMN